MNYLHDNSNLFLEIVLATGERFGIEKSIIIHDYYVWLTLKNIVKNVPNIIFKGGTSLSKCYGVINRYSEDIDLNCVQEEKLTKGAQKKYHHGILDSIKELGFEITNERYFKSGFKMNRIYAKVNDESKDFKTIKVETYLYIKSYPFQTEKATSYIYKYLKETGKEDLIIKYDLVPYDVRVQSITRTFIDKIFAICDYYETISTRRTSRHLYDLHKLLPHIIFDEKFYTLFSNVTLERRIGDIEKCISCNEGYDLIGTLNKIVKEDFYKNDYNNVTRNLLFEEVKYEECLNSLKQIILKLKVIK